MQRSWHASKFDPQSRWRDHEIRGVATSVCVHTWGSSREARHAGDHACTAVQARALHEAWRANATDVEQRLPHSAALLQHPTRTALARAFARAAACLLKHEGGGGAAEVAAVGDLDAVAASVVSWPQVLSYDTPEHMPTGRETSLPGTLARGVFIAREVGNVMIDMYDPRGPLDSMEVQDVVNDMYKCAAARRRCPLMLPLLLQFVVPLLLLRACVDVLVMCACDRYAWMCRLSMHVTGTCMHACAWVSTCSHSCMSANVGR